MLKKDSKGGQERRDLRIGHLPRFVHADGVEHTGCVLESFLHHLGRYLAVIQMPYELSQPGRAERRWNMETG